MFIKKCMCYGLNIARNWIAWTLYSETVISGLKNGFIGESFSFVVAYLVVGGLAKTLIVPAVFIVS